MTLKYSGIIHHKIVEILHGERLTTAEIQRNTEDDKVT